MVEKLLAAGADPNTTMPEGDTALMTAARTGNVGAVKALLIRGASVDARENWKGQTALMWAAAGNNAAAVQALIEAGADIQARTKYKPLPLARTGGIGRQAERNSDVTKQAGFTALHFAVRAGAADAVKLLLEAGATVRDTSSDGTGVLVLAIASTHYELADVSPDAGRRSECGGAGMDAASSDCIHATTQYGRQQPRPGPEGQAGQPHARPKTAGAWSESQPRRRRRIPTP